MKETATLGKTGRGSMLCAADGPRVTRCPLLLTVADTKGTYTIPHIQTSRRIRLSIDFGRSGQANALVRLLRGGTVVAEQIVLPVEPIACFPDLAPAEYTAEITARDRAGNVLGVKVVEPIGVGAVLAALGDSITEGYRGTGFHRADLNLRAEHFPPTAVSRDGRNFPQHAPTAHRHMPESNCFKSWMTTLNDALTGVWRRPVFVANEGVGGITAAAYLQMMRNDRDWQRRMRQLRPNVWLVHLGVNDGRAKRSPAAFAADMNAIVARLLHEYAARPERIVVAKPSYDYAPGAAPILAAYCAEIDRLVERRGLRPGPDFYRAYAVDRTRWYGDDPVHPNPEGMEHMARLWAKALEPLVQVFSNGPAAS
ncbi:MAG: SGNH/GDSL hydrolase family protein [Kiritimatiellaeota bacterium]|nr:SGNH/GDSL hydrolase family protein [Kiritimatiellota bacterium]